MFNPYEDTDDYAGARGCFKCGDPYSDAVFPDAFSTLPVGCTSCCPRKKDKVDKVSLGVLEMLLERGAGDKKKILSQIEKIKKQENK